MQKITSAIITIVSLLILTHLTGCNREEAEEYIVNDGFAQGSTYHIVCKAPDGEKMRGEEFSKELEESIATWFEEIDKSVSGYDSLSILSKINRGEDPQLDAIFIDIFNYSKKLCRESNGKVDPSAAPLFDLWGFGFKNGVEIEQKSIDSLKRYVGMEKLSIREELMPDGAKKHYLQRENPQIMLNFNAIAQGYTVDYFASRFDSMGITDYLIEIGGEIICKGVNPKSKEWKVGIDKPFDGNNIQGESLQAVIPLSNKALVTSGNYRKFYIKEGKKYSHTIDPISGYPVDHSLLSATVITGSATEADAYATYFMVVGLEEAKKILQERDDMEALLVYGEGERMMEFCTPGLEEMIQRR